MVSDRQRNIIQEYVDRVGEAPSMEECVKLASEIERGTGEITTARSVRMNAIFLCKRSVTKQTSRKRKRSVVKTRKRVAQPILGRQPMVYKEQRAVDCLTSLSKIDYDKQRAIECLMSFRYLHRKSEI